eukprot:g6694.t1
MRNEMVFWALWFISLNRDLKIAAAKRETALLQTHMDEREAYLAADGLTVRSPTPEQDAPEGMKALRSMWRGPVFAVILFSVASHGETENTTTTDITTTAADNPNLTTTTTVTILEFVTGEMQATVSSCVTLQTDTGRGTTSSSEFPVELLIVIILLCVVLICCVLPVGGIMWRKQVQEQRVMAVRKLDDEVIQLETLFDELSTQVGQHMRNGISFGRLPFAR